MASAEFRHAQRQFTVGTQALIENLHMTGTIHRLQRQHAVFFIFIFHARHEHVFAEFFPMAGSFPKLAIHKLRCLYFLIIGDIQAAAHIGFHRAIKPPALGVPKDRTHRFILQVKQAHFLADLAVVALFRFFQLQQIGVEFLLIAPGGAVNAAQHGVAMIAAPIGAGHFHQLEGGADITRAAHMRTAAQIRPGTLLVDADDFGFRQILDQFGFVAFTLVGEEANRIFAVPFFAHKGIIARDDFAHLGFDGGEVFRLEGIIAREIVIEAVFNRRADRDLRARVKRLHGFRQHMGAIMADHLQRFGIAPRDEAELCVLRDGRGKIAQLAIHFHGERRLGQARANRRRDSGARHRAVKLADGTIGQGNRGHEQRPIG